MTEAGAVIGISECGMRIVRFRNERQDRKDSVAHFTPAIRALHRASPVVAKSNKEGFVQPARPSTGRARWWRRLKRRVAWVYGVSDSIGSVIDWHDIVGAIEIPTPRPATSQEETVTVDAPGNVLAMTDRKTAPHTYTSLGRGDDCRRRVRCLLGGCPGGRMKKGGPFGAAQANLAVGDSAWFKVG